MSDFTFRLNKSLSKLVAAIQGGASDKYLLRLWSSLIRMRDGGSCVLCGSSSGLNAHHIFRKSFFTWAKYEPGNGISLCRACHKESHAKFNRKPDLGLPMDAQGGENIDLSIYYLGALLRNARSRHLLNDYYYYLSDQSLVALKCFQGIRDSLEFPGCRLEQADLIWRQTSRPTMDALLRANGFEMLKDLIQQGPMMGFAIFEDGTIQGV